ncbi:MAG: curved DNA-binding protein [Myxococcota bacterium]|jgi:curved DNA-binding protein
MAQNHYDVLGIDNDASTQDIKRAFRQIARECHPDVAGDDADKRATFQSARKSYETLMDPERRARYDRKLARKGAPRGGSFFDAFYRATGRAQEESKRSGPSWAESDTGGVPRGGRRNTRGNDVSLDDLFGDFGDFGPGPGERRRVTPEPEPDRSAEPGADVLVELRVPEMVAERGGSLTVTYVRMQRSETWKPGGSDPGIVRVQDIAEVRVIPGTREGEVLRERGLGSAGPHGGAYGDLVASVRIVGAEEASTKPTAEQVVEVPVVVALLGGRVAVETPRGPVKLGIRAGTSGGTRLRLRGRGEPDADGKPQDLFVRTRVVVPSELDDEARALIEQFAELTAAQEPAPKEAAPDPGSSV